MYADARSYKWADSLLKIVERQLSELKDQVDLLEEKDSETRNNHLREIENLEKQIALYKEQSQSFEKLWRKERRKRRLITAGGILTTGAAILLSLKK